MTIYKRNSPDTIDSPSIENMMFSEAAGAQKNSEVGRHLLPIPTPGVGTGFTTAVATATALPKMGQNIAVYNPTGGALAVTLGEDGTVTALAAGATDAAGHVGIPCKANDWTYIACAKQNWIISAAGLFVYLIDDRTSIQPRASK